MKRLLAGKGDNSPESYDRIFKERAKKAPDWFDMRRWEKLIECFDGGYIVDIGCLDSQVWSLVHTKFWKEQNYRYLGTDVAPKAIEDMAKRHPYANTDGEPLCSFIVDDVYQSQVRDGIADYVIMGEVLEHLEEPERAIREAFRILKPGGVLAISVPYNEAVEPGAVDGDRHVWSFDEKDLMELTKEYSDQFEYEILRSRKFPVYQYCFPQLVCWARKK